MPIFPSPFSPPLHILLIYSTVRHSRVCAFTLAVYYTEVGKFPEPSTLKKVHTEISSLFFCKMSGDGHQIS